MKNMYNFGGSSIDRSLYDWIINNLEPGKTILEFGSGNGSTGNLSPSYNMISIENDLQWCHKHKSFYIWATIDPKTRWFNISPIIDGLDNKNYDLILVDGPPAYGLLEGSRWGFYENINLFNTEIPIIIDDIHRIHERKMFDQLAHLLNKEKYIDSNWGVLI